MVIVLTYFPFLEFQMTILKAIKQIMNQLAKLSPVQIGRAKKVAIHIN